MMNTTRTESIRKKRNVPRPKNLVLPSAIYISISLAHMNGRIALQKKKFSFLTSYISKT